MAFAKAKSIAAPTTKAKKGSDRETIELPNIEMLASLHAISRMAAGAIKAIEGNMKDDVFDIFMERIVKTGKKPESVDAVEGLARANLQFKKRATTSPLTEDEIKTLADLAKKLKREDLKPTKQVKLQKLYAINPDLATDEKLMDRVEAALKAAKLDHVIIVQEEVSTQVVSDELLAAACDTKNPDVIRPMMTLAFKPTLTMIEPASIVKTMGELLDIDLKVGSDDTKLVAEVATIAKKNSAARKTPAKTPALLKA